MPAEKRPVARARQASLDEAPVPYGRLVRYEISGLFGQHDHAFDLELEEPTILTGANGTGKSTILRTINAIGTGAWPQLFALPFKSLTLRFEHSPLIRVTRLKGSLKVEHGGEAWRLNARDQRVRMQAAGLDLEVPLDQFEFDEPGLSQAAKAERVYRSLRAERAWRHERDLFEAGEIPEPLREISKRIRVRFVTDQRLVLYGDVPRRPASRRRASTFEQLPGVLQRDSAADVTRTRPVRRGISAGGSCVSSSRSGWDVGWLRGRFS